VLNSLPPPNEGGSLGALALASKDDGGSATLEMSPLAAEVLEVLMLRSAGCNALLLPTLEALTREESAEKLGGVVRVLLACAPLRRSELHGRAALRRRMETVQVAGERIAVAGEAMGEHERLLSAIVEPIQRLVPMLSGD
jgi:hypothetical protein